MSRIWTAGYEIGSLSNQFVETSPDGIHFGTSPTFDSIIKRSGNFSAKCRGISGSVVTGNTAGQGGIIAALVANRNYYLRWHMLWTTTETPVLNNEIFNIDFTGTSTNSAAIRVKGTSNGQITAIGIFYAINGLAPAQNGADINVSLDPDIWHRIEIRLNVISSTSFQFEVLIDGSSVYLDNAGSCINGSTVGPRQWYFGVTNNPSNTVSVWVDDVALNDDQGINQNTWPGDGHIVLLKPTADSAGGTGWTLGTGTALGGNGWNAIDNEPPISVADLTAGSDTKQIRNATSNANVSYDATMQTYKVAGLPSSAKINILVPIVCTAAPVTTSAKQGTVGVVSNPTITNIALGTIGTSGAFWQGSAAGTFPVGWKWSQGTITANPSVTLTTAPVMRITQVTSSTRIAMVCAMGIYVDYIPQSSLVAAVPGSAHARHRRAAQSFDRW